MNRQSNDAAVFPALLVGLAGTILVHAGLGYTLMTVESNYVRLRVPEPFQWERSRRLRARAQHLEVAFERRRIERDCRSIEECQPRIEPVEIELKVAKLGGKEPDKTKLPVIQKYEEPETIEESINVAEEPKKLQPLPIKDFLKRKAQLDKRRNKRKRPRRDLFNLDDDPRARPTAFEEITGRLDGEMYGKGADQEKFDTYFGKMALEMHRVFLVPNSLSKKQIKRQIVRLIITKMTADGSIESYRLKRKARSKAFTSAAEAAIRQFMPREGGTRRLPRPDADILAFVNDKGILVDLDGRLFQ